MASGENWIRVASLEELDQKRRLVCEVGGISILILRLGDDVVAVRNACTHLGQPLAEGRVMAGQIHCPFHGACFDLRTGTAVSGPAVAPLQRYAVKVEDSGIFIRLPG